MQRPSQILALLVYLALARLSLAIPSKALGRAAFAAVNVVAVSYFWHVLPDTRSPTGAIVRTVTYVGLVCVHYALTRYMSASEKNAAWPAILYPIVLLVAVKYPVFLADPLARAAHQAPAKIHDQLTILFIGVSYMAFRLSHLAVEVRNGVVKMPSLAEHIAFAFFVPIVPVGPISPASTFFASLDAPDRSVTPLGRSLLRILVGATKYTFIAGVLAHLTYADLLGDGHPHAGPIDWVVSGVAYYLHLYFNFSGFCDMAIGVAGLLGISVVENFDNPLAARNIKDFWNRWHMSLSAYVREMLFSPLSKVFARAFGGSRVNHAIALALLVTFVATGVWHGVGFNFFLFGVLHGGAMVVHHYYTLFLRQRLARETLKRYQASRLVHAACVAVTFAFVTGTFFVFANDLATMKALLRVSADLPERQPLP